MPFPSEALEEGVPHLLPTRPVRFGVEKSSGPPCRGGVGLPFVEDDAVPKQGVEQRIAGIFEAHDIHFDPCGRAEVRRQAQQIEVLAWLLTAVNTRVSLRSCPALCGFPRISPKRDDSGDESAKNDPDPVGAWHTAR
jgi:hypothetical protein